jgi:exodeoxyribonuclease-3
MKIAAWNVNSIRARQERLMQWIASRAPDVVCLQETKCVDAEFPSLELKTAGYDSACYGQRSYNGVAIVSKLPIMDLSRGMGDEPEDQARVISATIGPLRVICAYAPNGQAVDSPAFAYKLQWYERLRRYVDVQREKTPLIVLTGDFNVAPEPRDVHDPALWEGQTMFTLQEREALGRLVAAGLVDTFRLHHSEDGRFSWWDYRMLAFPKNRGLRIDHLYASRPLAEKCTAADIDREARKGSQPSDHAPIWAEFAL